MPPLPFRARRAVPADVPALTALIDASIRRLGGRDYDPRQVASSLDHLFGVDTRLIEDGTYFVVEVAGEIVGCGGWSRRKTPFGGDRATAVQDASLRDPATDPAVLRAFYVHPRWERRGIGRRLVELCEAEAGRAGFARFELVSTLTGLPLYRAMGYRDVEPMTIRLPDGVELAAVKMVKP